MEFDAIVVGAGPAGSATAGWLGRAGLKVLLIDKASFPRDKPCGEGILPPGVKALKRMGLLEALRPFSRPLTGIAYSTRVSAARMLFPAGASGLGVRRIRLDGEILRWALAGGVRFEDRTTAVEPVFKNGRVRGVVARSAAGARARWEAPLTVCAEGVHSVLRSKLGIGLRWPRRARMARVAHFDRVEGVSDHVEVSLGPLGEAYLTPTADGVSAAFLYEGRFMDSLGDRLRGARRLDEFRTWGPLGPEADKIYGEGFLLVGDSAGAPDPIAGEGLSLALACAEIGNGPVIRAVQAGGSAAELARYAALRTDLMRSASALSRALVALSRWPRLRERVVGNLARRPPIFEKLLEVACGGRPYSSFGLIDRLRLVC